MQRHRIGKGNGKYMSDNDKKTVCQVINVRKSNSLIESIGKTSLLSHKVFITSLLKIENRTGVIEKEKKEYYKRLQQISGTDFSQGLVAEISNVELRKSMGTKSGSYYSSIRELMDPRSEKSLRNQWVHMVKDTESGMYGSTDVITATLYDENKGTMYIKFSNEKKIQDELFNLKGNYTWFSYDLIMSFKYLHTFRIYELMTSRIDKQDAFNPKRKTYSFYFNLSELKYLLGLLDPYINNDVKNALMQPNPDYEMIENKLSGEKVMPRYNDLQKYALSKAKEEIDAYTDYIFDYEPVRNGRGAKVIGVDLLFTRKSAVEDEEPKKEITEDVQNDVLDMVISLFEEKVKMKDMKAICEAANYEYEKIEKAYKILKSSSVTINNFVGFMIKAIEDDYDEPMENVQEEKKQKKKTSFNNFEQRQYDYNELEKMLLNTNANT